MSLLKKLNSKVARKIAPWAMGAASLTPFYDSARAGDVTSPVSVSLAIPGVDNDGDGLLNSTEATLGTNPNKKDTDGDGLNDNIEVGMSQGNPLNYDAPGIGAANALYDAPETSIEGFTSGAQQVISPIWVGRGDIAYLEATSPTTYTLFRKNFLNPSAGRVALDTRIGSGFRQISTDGDKIYFNAANPSNTRSVIYFVDSNGVRTEAYPGQGRTVPYSVTNASVEAVKRLTDDDHNGTSETLSIDPSKHWLFFQAATPSTNAGKIMAAHLGDDGIWDGTAVKTIADFGAWATTHPTETGLMRAEIPKISPDGKTIVYSQVDSSKGTNRLRMSSDVANVLSGARLAYTGANGDGVIISNSAVGDGASIPGGITAAGIVVFTQDRATTPTFNLNNPLTIPATSRLDIGFYVNNRKNFVPLETGNQLQVSTTYDGRLALSSTALGDNATNLKGFALLASSAAKIINHMNVDYLDNMITPSGDKFVSGAPELELNLANADFGTSSTVTANPSLRPLTDVNSTSSSGMSAWTVFGPSGLEVFLPSGEPSSSRARLAASEPSAIALQLVKHYSLEELSVNGGVLDETTLVPVHRLSDGSFEYLPVLSRNLADHTITTYVPGFSSVGVTGHVLIKPNAAKPSWNMYDANETRGAAPVYERRASGLLVPSNTVYSAEKGLATTLHTAADKITGLFLPKHMMQPSFEYDHQLDSRFQQAKAYMSNASKN